MLAERHAERKAARIRELGDGDQRKERVQPRARQPFVDARRGVPPPAVTRELGDQDEERKEERHVEES